MPDNPEVKVVLTAEDQGVAAAIRQLSSELNNLKSKQDQTVVSAKKLTGSFKDLTAQALNAVKLRLANIPGLGNFGSMLALRAYEPVGKIAEEVAGDLEEKFGAAALAVGGTAAAVVALGAVAIGVTHHMMELAQSIENTSAATGLSNKQVQEYNELAKEMDVDAGSLQMAFARIQTQLGEYVTTGKAAGNGSQYFIRVLKEMNVAIADSQGKLRPVNDILGDFADKIAQIPDKETRVALEMAALGTRGRVLAQVMEEAAREGLSLRDALASIDASGNVIPDSQLDDLMEAKRRWDDLMRSIRGVKTELEGFIAEAVTHPLKGMISITAGVMGASPGEVNALMSAMTAHPGAKPEAGGQGGNPLLVAQLAAENEKLAERVALLRAGGEYQLQLKQAETAYAAALKSGDVEQIKQYSTEINYLHQIIALDAEKKKKREADTERAAPEAAAKARLALSLKQQQDALSVEKSGAEERAAIEKGEYERGLLSIAQYYSDRRAAIENETRKEIAAVATERDQVQAAANLAGEHAAAASSAARTARTPADRQRLAAEADRYTAEQINSLEKLDEINTRISEAEISSRTRLTELGNQQFHAEEEQKKKILELENRITLASETDLKNKQKATEEGLRQIDLDRDTITAGGGSQAQKQQAYLALLRQEMPLLQQKAQAELRAAQASGDTAAIQNAQRTLLQLRQLDAELTQLGQKWQQTLGQSLKNTFAQTTDALLSGSRDIGQAFAGMERSVVNSLIAMGEQMLVNALLQKSISEGTKLDDAKTAARRVFKSASALPFPLNVIIAPAAAAAAFAAVMAFERGGIVPGRPGEPVPIMAHAQEMVLPARISAGMQSMIETGMPQPRAIASLHDFSRPSFELPEHIAASAARTQYIRNEYNLHHNGPDALEVLQTQLVPAIKEAHRAGRLDLTP